MTRLGVKMLLAKFKKGINYSLVSNIRVWYAVKDFLQWNLKQVQARLMCRS